MDRIRGVGRGVSDAGPSYYTILGIRKDASFSDIRTAYRKLALKWHPDRWAQNPALAGESKRQFQLIQEAYSVLSNQAKRSVYDAGLYDPTEEEDEEFCDFMQEMISMMKSVKPEGDSFEDLQRMFVEMVGSDSGSGSGSGSGSDEMGFCGKSVQSYSYPTAKKRASPANGSRSEAVRPTPKRGTSTSSSRCC